MDGAVDYRVRLRRATGEAVSDADVRLRGVMADGLLVEARLDRGEAPGAYRGLVRFSPRGPRNLTLLVSRDGRATEIPLADAVRANSPSSSGR